MTTLNSNAHVYIWNQKNMFYILWKNACWKNSRSMLNCEYAYKLCKTFYFFSCFLVSFSFRKSMDFHISGNRISQIVSKCSKKKFEQLQCTFHFKTNFSDIKTSSFRRNFFFYLNIWFNMNLSFTRSFRNWDQKFIGEYTLQRLNCEMKVEFFCWKKTIEINQEKIDRRQTWTIEWKKSLHLTKKISIKDTRQFEVLSFHFWLQFQPTRSFR